MMVESEIKKKIEALKIPENVKLIAVSKTKPETMIIEAHDFGQKYFGENRIQDAVLKIQNLHELKNIEWHFIGHLQSNKAKLAAEYFDMIQTIDSRKIALKLNQCCKELNKVLPILIQINIGNEDQKSGIKISQINTIIKEISKLDNLSVKGFMCIHPFNKKPEPYFRKMKDIFDNYKEKYNLSELSMGMSEDYDIAIKFGATMVRVGTKIFGTRL